MDTVKAVLEMSPWHRYLQLSSESAADGRLRVRLGYRREFRRDEASEVLHGGFAPMLSDIAAWCAVVQQVGHPNVTTVDMRVDYIGPAGLTDLYATAWAVRVGRAIATADVELRSGEKDEVIGLARATFRVAAPVTNAG